MSQTKEPFADWAILELMGHRRLAGFVQEVELAGSGVLRIDIPNEPPLTQFYPPSAIYCLTPTTEELARALGKRAVAGPVSYYELPPAIPRCCRCGIDLQPGSAAYPAPSGFMCAVCHEDDESDPS